MPKTLIKALLMGTVLLTVFASQSIGLALEPPLSEATVNIIDKERESIGSAILRETPRGVLIHLVLKKGPVGTHAFHIHEVGKCEPPDFHTAGGHLNPMGLIHGIMSPKGFHLGDLPNIYIRKNEVLEIEILVPESSLDSFNKNMLDEDGATLIIHERKDDYRTNPLGDAGARIACGIIEKG